MKKLYLKNGIIFTVQTEIYGLFLCQDFNQFSNHYLSYWPYYNKNIKMYKISLTLFTSVITLNDLALKNGIMQ